MRLIDADDLIVQLRQLYKRENWDEREIHFSLLDMECNIGDMETALDDWDLVEMKEKLNDVKAMLNRALVGKNERNEAD